MECGTRSKRPNRRKSSRNAPNMTKSVSKRNSNPVNFDEGAYLKVRLDFPPNQTAANRKGPATERYAKRKGIHHANIRYDDERCWITTSVSPYFTFTSTISIVQGRIDITLVSALEKILNPKEMTKLAIVDLRLNATGQPSQNVMGAIWSSLESIEPRRICLVCFHDLKPDCFAPGDLSRRNQSPINSHVTLSRHCAHKYGSRAVSEYIHDLWRTQGSSMKVDVTLDPPKCLRDQEIISAFLRHAVAVSVSCETRSSINIRWRDIQQSWSVIACPHAATGQGRRLTRESGSRMTHLALLAVPGLRTLRVHTPCNHKACHQATAMLRSLPIFGQEQGERQTVCWRGPLLQGDGLNVRPAPPGVSVTTGTRDPHQVLRDTRSNYYASNITVNFAVEREIHLRPLRRLLPLTWRQRRPVQGHNPGEAGRRTPSGS